MSAAERVCVAVSYVSELGRCKHTHTGAQFARNIITWLLEKGMLAFFGWVFCDDLNL